MSTSSPEVRDLARRLLALEVVRGEPSHGHIYETMKVCEKLRVVISNLVGVAGFGSLLSRALALAKAEVPSLGVVKVRADGSLDGVEEVGRGRDAGAGWDGGVVLVAQLLGLLVTFIGRPLTLTLVRDAWPAATLDGVDLGTGDMP